MIVKRMSTTAAFMQSATIHLALITVHVSRDSKEMEFHVKISMNVPLDSLIAVIINSVITPLVLLIVPVLEDSKVMVRYVTMLMSAVLISIIAAYLHSAITLLARTTALVAQASKEMDAHATTLMSARMGLTSVTTTQCVRTLWAFTNAPAILGFLVMVKCVKMLMNVSKG